jgi:hypothetical protein
MPPHEGVRRLASALLFLTGFVAIWTIPLSGLSGSTSTGLGWDVIATLWAVAGVLGMFLAFRLWQDREMETLKAWARTLRIAGP